MFLHLYCQKLPKVTERTNDLFKIYDITEVLLSAINAIDFFHNNF